MCHLGLRLARFSGTPLFGRKVVGRKSLKLSIESYVATPAAHAAAQLAYVYTYLWLCDLRPAEGSRASGGGQTEMTSRLIHEVVRPAMMLSDPPPRAS